MNSTATAEKAARTAADSGRLWLRAASISSTSAIGHDTESVTIGPRGSAAHFVKFLQRLCSHSCAGSAVKLARGSRTASVYS